MQTAQDNDVPPSGGPPPGPPPLSRLTRSTEDKVVSGLCGGLGRHFAVDPIVIRVAFVVLTLAGGTGILLYLVGWALIPDDQGGVIGARAGETRALRWMGEDRSRKLLAAVIAGGGLLILLNRLFGGNDGDVTLGVVLVGLGAAFLWSRRNAGKVPPGASSPFDAGPGGGGTWVVPPAAPPDAPAAMPNEMPAADAFADTTHADTAHADSAHADSAHGPSPSAGPPTDPAATPSAGPPTDPAATSAAEPPSGSAAVEVDPKTPTAEPPSGSAAVEVDPTTPPAATPAGPDPFRATPDPLPPITGPMPLAAWPPAGTGPAPATMPYRPARMPKPPKPTKPRSVLVACTFSVLAIQAGILVLAGASLVIGLALSVLVVGLALVVGTWMGRARWLIPVGLLLSLALGAAVLLDVPVAGGTGGRVHRPVTLADLRSPYRLAAGEMTVDLASVDLAGTTTDVDASVAMGHLVVVVPAGAELDLTGQVNAGTLVVFGRSWGGTAVKQDVVIPGREGGGRLVLDAQVGVGELEVRRAAA